MERIWADFNRLGTMDEENIIPLGPDDAINLVGHDLHDGDRIIVYEEGSLEAEGILQSTLAAGQRFWLVLLDLATLRHLDVPPIFPSEATHTISAPHDN